MKSFLLTLKPHNKETKELDIVLHTKCFKKIEILRNTRNLIICDPKGTKNEHTDSRGAMQIMIKYGIVLPFVSHYKGMECSREGIYYVIAEYLKLKTRSLKDAGASFCLNQ